MATQLGHIHALQVGEPIQMAHGSKEVLTGIVKQKVTGPLLLQGDGLPGDRQADLVNHGGPDKAVCVYFLKHYPYWQQWMDKPLGDSAFGENLTIDGGDESSVCIGDVLRIGGDSGPLVQVSQPRVPCFKLGLRHGNSHLPAQVLQTGYCGLYLRVLSSGQVEAGQAITFVERDPAQLSISEAMRIMMIDKQDRAGVERLLAIQALAKDWQDMANKRLVKLKGTDD